MSKEISGRELLEIYYSITPNSDGSDRVERVIREASCSWVLKCVKISDISFSVESVEAPSSIRLIKKYKKIKTEIPPVILDIFMGQYEIVDGFHRIAVAKERGDSSIMAYVPFDQ